MQHRGWLWCTILLSLFFAVAALPQTAELSGYVAIEARAFPQAPLLPEQFSGGNLAFSLQPEFYYESGNGSDRILFVPFMRADQHDGNRTHFDIRELYWQHVADWWELSLGMRKIFWGVAESQHLVDIINQTDQLENLDTEDKLGQPMAHLSIARNWGILDLFILPYFRERSFLAHDARLRLPVPIARNRTRYESDDEEWHLDWAARWFHSISIFDVGLSHFSGTSREAVVEVGAGAGGELFLAPFYPIIGQTGLDMQATTGAWLLKLEAIRRTGQGDAFFASTTGFEYTFNNIKNTGADIGVLLEYHYDERGKDASSPFDDDIFVGSRLALNDVQSTDLLAGFIVDRDNGATFLNLEASRRIRDRYRMEVEFRSFLNAEETDLFFGLRKDHYFQVEFSRFF